MQLQTVWMLSDFTKENGGTKVATGTHLFPTNPTSAHTKVAYSNSGQCIVLRVQSFKAALS